CFCDVGEPRAYGLSHGRSNQLRVFVEVEIVRLISGGNPAPIRWSNRADDGGRVHRSRPCDARHLANDELLVLENDDSLDHVLELADVARPLVRLEELLELYRQLALRTVVPPRVLIDEEFSEMRNFAASV